jgi:hypothetical protein
MGFQVLHANGKVCNYITFRQVLYLFLEIMHIGALRKLVRVIPNFLSPTALFRNAHNTHPDYFRFFFCLFLVKKQTIFF